MNIESGNAGYMPALRFLSKYWRTLLGGVVVILITVWRYAGLFLAFVILWFCIWLVYTLVVIYRKPERRREQLTRIAIWVGAILLVSSVHWYRVATTREGADQVAALITQYRSTQGNYPPNLAAIGKDADSYRQDWGLQYVNDKGMPRLVYAAPFVLFESYRYDFEKRRWARQSD